MHLAIISGQPFLHLLDWHPRDVDTLQQHYHDQDPDFEAKQREREMIDSHERLRRSTVAGTPGF